MWTRAVAAVVACLVVVVAEPATQQLPDASLRAAYLFNFARYTDWPVEVLPANAVLTFCTDDQSIFGALKTAVTDKTINNRPLRARHLSDPADTKGCQVAYLRRLTRGEATRLGPGYATARVFTVVDTAEVMHAGTVAHFFIEDRRLRFAIHLPHATNAGLQLSARLLSLAVVHRRPDAEAAR